MSRVKSLNIKYVASQVFYFATFAAMMGYASVYLLHNWYNFVPMQYFSGVHATGISNFC